MTRPSGYEMKMMNLYFRFTLNPFEFRFDLDKINILYKKND